MYVGTVSLSFASYQSIVVILNFKKKIIIWYQALVPFFSKNVLPRETKKWLVCTINGHSVTLRVFDVDSRAVWRG